MKDLIKTIESINRVKGKNFKFSYILGLIVGSLLVIGIIGFIVRKNREVLAQRIGRLCRAEPNTKMPEDIPLKTFAKVPTAPMSKQEEEKEATEKQEQDSTTYKIYPRV